MEPFRDPKLSFDERADDLLARLTPAERVGMLHQRSPAVGRLGLAEWHTGQEALHGAAWRGEATVFPQAIGLGATWDPRLVQAVGEAAAREVRAKRAENPLVSCNVWSPVVNLLRDPRWGRNEEGYSEDPLLTATMAIAYCRGLAGADASGYLRTAPTLKHFLAHNNEVNRDTTSSSVRPRVLNEYDIPPFRGPVEAGAATGIMPAYNLVNGRPNHVSPLLELARSWTDGELLFCSDAWAPSNLVDTEHYFPDHASSHAAALRAGLDSFTDKDGDGSFTTAAVTEALSRDLITMADVDRAVRRKLLTRLRLGEFDQDGGPFAADAALLTDAHRRTAREVATRAPVLLQNDDGLLPLAPGTSIAVAGPLARELFEDWYSGTLPYKVTIADGLAALAGVTLAGVTVGGVTVGGVGVGGVGVAGVTVADGLDRVRLGDLGLFEIADWGGDVVTLRSGETGRYLSSDLTVSSPGPHGWVVQETFIRDGARLRSVATGDVVPAELVPVSDGVAEAARAAAAADVAVVVVGNHPMINGRETQDRDTLAFPPRQRDLIRAVTAANPRTVLVIMSSYPYLVPHEARTVLWTSHGGQETGHAIADLLTGAAAPSGRLPQTWYASDDDLPDILDYDIIKARRTYQYFAGRPRYPFGHGLTYTTFHYSNLRISRSESVVTARLDVANTGSRPGSEMVQVYIQGGRPPSDTPRAQGDYPSPRSPQAPRARGGFPSPRSPQAPVRDRVGSWPRRLAGFTRITLGPGETGVAEIAFPLSELAVWDVDTHAMTVFGGDYDLLVGASSADIRLTGTLTVAGPGPGPRDLAGREIRAADFDDHDNIILVDETPAAGDAVTPKGTGATPRPLEGQQSHTDDPPSGRLVYRDALLAGAERITLRVAGGPGAIEVGYGADRLVAVTLPGTGGKYAWTEVSGPVTPADDEPRDVVITLTEGVRFAWFRFDP